ncbi:tRNA(Ile)-lysidine synthase [Planctomycetales bacterium 10988]|nr:tRNA(Ile)-lysidine synthase [Planctomycetales bacterium 10988]
MNPFEDRLLENWPSAAWQGQTILVAVSGGADSVALLRLLHAICGKSSFEAEISRPPTKLIVGHINHQSRGEASDEDAEFVQRLAEELQLPCRIERIMVEPRSELRRESWESAAREARYAILQKWAEEISAKWLVTAHTQDDQVETILHRVLRGTGLTGLAGIPPERSLSDTLTLARPLLSISKQELLDYLSAIKQSFREDHTNTDPTFTRNRIRHELLPLLETSFNPKVQQSLLQLSQLAGEAQSLIDLNAEHWVSIALVESTPSLMEWDLALLPEAIRQSPAMLREILRTGWRQQGWPEQGMTFSHWNRLAELASGPRRREMQMFPKAIRVMRRRERLVVGNRE